MALMWKDVPVIHNERYDKSNNIFFSSSFMVFYHPICIYKQVEVVDVNANLNYYKRIKFIVFKCVLPEGKLRFPSGGGDDGAIRCSF